MKYERSVVTIIALMVGAMIITAVVLILLQVMFSQYMNQLYNFVCVSISTITGFIVYPAVLLRKTYNVSLESLGIGKLKFADWLAFVISTSLVTGAYCISGKQTEWFVLLVAQNLIVACAEEFLCRGALIFILEEIINSKLLVGILSIAIFVFAVHSNAPVIENMIWRLPVSTLIVYAYMRCKSLYIPFTIHFTYNIIISFV